LQGLRLQDLILQGLRLQDLILQGLRLQDLILQGLRLQDLILQETHSQGLTLQVTHSQGLILQDSSRNPPLIFKDFAAHLTASRLLSILPCMQLFGMTTCDHSECLTMCTAVFCQLIYTKIDYDNES